MRPALALVLAALATLAACGDDGPSSTCLPDCPGDRGYDAVAYHLSARFDWAALTLHAVEDVTLVPAAPVVELDADLEVSAVHAGGRQLAFANDRTAGTLRVDLGPIVGDGGPVDFTIDYTAGVSDALIAGGPRDDDPVTSHVVFTDSEPDRGLRWLAAKHDPSDRALWSVDITLPSGEDVIANGTRAGDQLLEGERIVSYHLDQPIPTYLMAFAAGELAHTDRTVGRVPLSVWYRRGLLIQPEVTLDQVADAMATFEQLIGPYPWDTYAVVLVPNYGGGMENATITFNLEGSGQGAGNFSLNAHELAHHWFGDWVTMRHYDDVWVKEGMATFLAAEATRADRDDEHVGRAYGNDFSFNPGDAIVDPQLHGLDKYTSGPYERAAWVITQVRTLVGEDAFWAGLRSVQSTHAVGDVDGADFLGAFPLAPAARAQLTASLPARDIAHLTATYAAGGTGTTVTFTLDDPLGTIAAPLEVVTVDAAGAATPTPLVAGGPLAIEVPVGGYLAPDPHGNDPDWLFVFDVDGSLFDLPSLYAPTAAPAITDFLHRSPAHQEVAMSDGAPLPAAADFAAFYAGLDSQFARNGAFGAACRQLATADPGDATLWTATLHPAIQAQPFEGFRFVFDCKPAFVQQELGAELGTAVAAPTVDNAARLEYLISFDYGPATSLDRIGRLATTAPSLRMRDLALSRLQQQTNGFTFGYSAIPTAEKPAWRAFFRDRFAAITSAGRLSRVWRASNALGDVAALPLVAPLLHSVPASEDLQLQIVCDANRLAASQPGAWEAFQAATMPWSTLSTLAAAALADPATVCASKRTAPREELVDDAIDHQRSLHDR